MKKIVVMIVSLIGLQASIYASDGGAAPASPAASQGWLDRVSSSIGGMTPQRVKDAMYATGQAVSPLVELAKDNAVKTWNMVSPQQRSARAQAVEEWFKCERTVEALGAFVERQKKSGNFDDTTILSDLVNAHNTEGRTLIQELFFKDAFDINLDLVQGILNLGGDINARDKEGNTLLHMLSGDDVLVVEKKDLPVIARFIQMGANPKLVDQDGKTVLHLLAQPPAEGHDAQVFDEEMIGWWVAKGVDPRVQDQRGNTIAHIFAQRGNLADNIATYTCMFEDHGIDPNATDKDGETVIHILAAHGLDTEPYDAILLLKNLGVYLDAQNGDQENVFDIFELYDDCEITQEMITWWKDNAGIIYPKPNAQPGNGNASQAGDDSQGTDLSNGARRKLTFSTPSKSSTSMGNGGSVPSPSGASGSGIMPLTPQSPPPVSRTAAPSTGVTGGAGVVTPTISQSAALTPQPQTPTAATPTQPTKSSLLTKRTVTAVIAVASAIGLVLYWKKTQGAPKRTTDQVAATR